MSEEEHTVEDVLGIRVDIALEQQTFRLIELPDPFMELVASGNPPLDKILQLKSAVAPSHSSDPAPTAYLCSHDTAFEIRQVHSSNILYVLQSSSLNPETSLKNIARTGVTAIAQCRALLELVSASESAKDYLLKSMPLYESPESVKLCDRVLSRDALLADAPFSRTAFEQSAVEICAFECKGTLWLPTATALVNMWKSLMSAMAVKGIKTSASFPMEEVRVFVEEDGHESALLQAVLTRLKPLGEDNMADWPKIDKGLCVPWLGTVILESYGQDGAVQLDLLTQWKDNLPEAWREDADFDRLEGQYRETDGKITSTSLLVERQAEMRTGASPLAPRSTSRWHEKFKGSK